MTTRQRTLQKVDAALARPDVRKLFEEYKRCVADATAHPPETEPHLRSASAAREQAFRIIDAIDPRGPREAIYRYLANVAMVEMLPPSPVGLQPPELSIALGPGRPPGTRPKLRQQLLNEWREHPDMTSTEVHQRGVELGWWDDAGEDYDLIRKRVTRLRRDLTK